MKKLQILVLLLAFSLSAYCHSLTRQCWNNVSHTYGIEAAYGDANGKIEVTVYTNSNMSTVIQTKRTFILNGSGTVDFTVNQASRTSPVFVYVRWFSRNNNGTYSPVTWNSGQGYPNSYSSIITSTNQCSIVPIKFTSVTARRINSNTFEVVFDINEVVGVNYYRIKLSTDGINFKERAVIFPDNTTSGRYSAIIHL